MKKNLFLIICLLIPSVVYSANLTIKVEGPGMVEEMYFGTIEHFTNIRDTTVVISYDPRDHDLSGYLLGGTLKSDNPFVVADIESELEIFLLRNDEEIGHADMYVFDIWFNEEDVWNDNFIVIKFSDMDLSDYVPINYSYEYFCELNIEGDLLVDGIETISYSSFPYGSWDNSYFPLIYAKKGSKMRISGYGDLNGYVNLLGDLGYNLYGYVFDGPYLSVNGEEYSEGVCYLFDINDAINASISYDMEFQGTSVKSEGPGTTKLFYKNDSWGFVVEDYFSLSPDDDNWLWASPDKIVAMPNEGNKIIQLLEDDHDILKERYLEQTDFNFSDSITINWDYSNYYIQYGPIDIPFVSADNIECYYGDVLNEFAWHVYDGNIDGVPELSCKAGTTKIGKHDINIGKGTITTECSLHKGTLNVKKAPLTVKVPNYTIMEGDDIPNIELIYEGFKNGEDKSCLFREPHPSTVRDSTEPGTYTIIVSGGETPNYEFIYQEGTLTILPSDKYIYFADDIVKGICLSKWDADKDKKLSKEEAADVKDINGVFTANDKIKSFDELKYFTGLETIPDEAFKNCSSLETVTLPESISQIGNSAFLSCKSLTNINIPANVAEIGQTALSRCKKLASITVDPDNQFFTSIDGVLFSKDSSTLIQFPIAKSNTEYDVPEQTQVIGRDAFYQSDLTTINLPTTLSTLVYDAFGECIYLTDIILPEGLTTMEDYCFDRCTSLVSIALPSTLLEMGEKNFRSCNSLKDVYCFSQTPFAIADNNFTSTAYSQATLHVPEGFENTYAILGGWKNFSHIIGDITSEYNGIASVTPDHPVDVYNIQGTLVRQQTTSLAGLPRGIYIIDGRKVGVK